jgi:hypothetical protein
MTSASQFINPAGLYDPSAHGLRTSRSHLQEQRLSTLRVKAAKMQMAN